MNRLTALGAALLTVGLLATAAPAQAQVITVSDPAGDTFVPGLDITSATFSNHVHAFVAALTFVKDSPGAMIVGVETRDKNLVRVVSEHRSQGNDKVYLLDRQGQTVPCSGLTSTWNRASATLALRMPARCWPGGGYTSLRCWALTEVLGSGRDVDYAPENANGDIRFTHWFSRG